MTVERKIRIQEEQADLIEHYAEYGFHDADEMIGRALELLKQELELIEALESSAELYAEVYESDVEAKEWVEASTQDWD